MFCEQRSVSHQSDHQIFVKTLVFDSSGHKRDKAMLQLGGFHLHRIPESKEMFTLQANTYKYPIFFRKPPKQRSCLTYHCKKSLGECQDIHHPPSVDILLKELDASQHLLDLVQLHGWDAIHQQATGTVRPGTHQIITKKILSNTCSRTDVNPYKNPPKKSLITMDPLKFGVPTEFPPFRSFSFWPFQNFHQMPCTIQLLRCCQPCWTTTNDTHTPARSACRWLRPDPTLGRWLVPIRCQWISIHKLLKASGWQFC